MAALDLTALQPNPPRDLNEFKLFKGKVAVRDPKTVTGLMLHQTAAWYSVSRDQLAAAGGDRHAALHLRALNIAAHITAFDGKKATLCGHALHCNPLDWYVYHGNNANRMSIGIECEGVYAGLVKMAGEQPSARLIQAGRDAIAYAVEQGRAQGMPIEFIWAHRQSSGTRRADPGEALWRALVVEYAVPVLKLKTQPKRVWENGRPIPLSWDPGGVGAF